MELKFKKLTEDAILPTRGHDGDAGLDLYATEQAYIHPKIVTPVSTGLAVEIPYGYVGLIHPRSGLAFKDGITVVNAPGTIDAGYRGEIKVALSSLMVSQYEVKPGDRIAQLVVQKVELPTPVEVDELSDHARGENGFGSTGA